MLSPEEGRVLGCLVEKELTTPQGYPLTDSALLAACNQATSGDPVVDYDLAVLRPAVRSLREQGLLRTVHRTGERSDKHQHELRSAMSLSVEQTAVLAVLLLRGPQTASELRTRTERMATLDAEVVLHELADRGLAQELERQPGQSATRWVQLLAEGSAVSAAPVASPREDEVALLRAEVAELRALVERLLADAQPLEDELPG